MTGRAMTVAVLMAVFGIAASVPLIPGERELAFLRFKDKLFDQARADLEARLAQGDLSVSVVRPLAELYLQYADVDAAILLLERFVAEHPDDLAARRLLGTYYQYGQRPYDYLRNLEQIALRAPSEAILRELAEIYSWVDEPDRQMAVLGRLERMGRATPDELVGLARLRASRGLHAEAIAALDRVEALAPAALDDEALDLLAALLADTGRPDVAVTRLSQVPVVRADPQVAVRLAGTLHGRGHPAHAARLLEAVSDLRTGEVPALVALTQAEVDAGRPDRALARLGDLLARGMLPSALLPTLVELAVFQDDLDLAWKAVGAPGQDPTGLPARVVGMLVAASFARGRTTDIQALLARLGGDEVLADVPLVAARLAMQRGDPISARRWAAAAAATAGRSDDDEAALAALERDLGAPDRAYHRVQAVLARGTTSVWAVEVFGQLAILTGRSAEAVPLIERHRRAGLTGVDDVWARVATAAGRADEVLAWLRGPRGPAASPQTLRDIAYAALDRKAAPLALEAARRLVAHHGPTDDRVLLARALLEHGEAREALAWLRPLARSRPAAASLLETAIVALAPHDRDARTELVALVRRELSSSQVTPARRAAWVEALVQAGAHDAALPVIESLLADAPEAWATAYVASARHARVPERAAAQLVVRLADDALPTAARGALVRALLDLGAVDAALPHVRTLALAEGTSWFFLVDEVLGRRDRRAERVRLWRQVGHDAEVPTADRRAAAFRLLDLRDKAGAEAVLLTLAEQEAPDGPAVAQLLHLWGPRPSASSLAWLQRRALTATPGERAHWLRHLVACGAAARVKAILGEPPRPEDQAVLAVWVDALRVVEDRETLARTIEDVARRSRDPSQLAWAAEVARAEGLADAAAAAFEAWLARDDRALEARRWLGLRALDRHDSVAASEHLEHYVAAGGRDPDTLLRYGDALLGRGRRDAARRVWGLALAETERRGLAARAVRRAHALLLARLGRQEQAFPALEALLREDPADGHLRADFAALLLGARRYDDARRVLDLR